jgi:hypothetical protein
VAVLDEGARHRGAEAGRCAGDENDHGGIQEDEVELNRGIVKL